MPADTLALNRYGASAFRAAAGSLERTAGWLADYL